MRAIVVLLLCIAIPSLAQRSDPEKLFNEAMAAQQRGDLQSAIAGYEHVLKLVPNLAAAHANLAAAEMQTGRKDEALAHYQAAVKEEPANTQLVLLYGNALLGLSRYSQAVQVLTPAHKAHPQDLNVAFVLGEALIRDRRPKQGLPLVEHVARERNDADAYLLAGLTHLQLLDFPEASACAAGATRINPNDPAAWTLVGMTDAASGNTNDAEAAYKKALTLDPNDYEANLRLGTVLLRTDLDFDSAKIYLEKALSLNPSSASARFELAKVAAAGNRDDEAIADLEQVEKAVPGNIDVHVQLSVLYSRNGRRQDSVRERKIVDRLMQEPVNPEDELEALTASARSR